MNRLRLLLILLPSVFLFLGQPATGQFYNGHQMNFGKNRVQYYDLYWTYYRFDDFDCYFNEYGKDLAKYTAEYSQRMIDELEDYFDYQLEKRLIFIVYNKQAEFRQTNIGLVTGNEDYNVGGYSRIIKNKIMLYFEGDYNTYDKQIKASIVEAITNEMFYNADMKDRIAGSSQIYFPDWYTKGLINYIAFNWDFNTDNRVRDGFKSGLYRKLDHLEYDDALYAGQSFWKYIGATYGDAMIPNIIYLTKVYRNVDEGFRYVLGLSMKELTNEWISFYEKYYSDDIGTDPGNGGVIARAKKEEVITSVKVSPDGTNIAYVTNLWGRRKIKVHNTITGKTRTLLKAEPKYEQRVDYTYPIIAWHPSGKILTYINEEKAGLKVYFHRIAEKTTEERNIFFFDKILDFSYSPDGSQFVFSALKDGFTDIYLQNISSWSFDPLTRDIADDLNPSFVTGSPGVIVFSSDRLSDTLTNSGDPLEKRASTYSLFTYDVNKRDRILTRLEEGKYTDKTDAKAISKRSFFYKGNNSGIDNIYSSRFDSTISYIDTTTHYRYYLTSKPLTNYNRAIDNFDLSSDATKRGEVVFSGNRYNLSLKDSGEEAGLSAEGQETKWRHDYTRLLHKADSIELLRQWLLEEDRKRRDTLTRPLYEYFTGNEPIDINYYIFEKEKENYYDQLWRKDYMDIDLDTAAFKFGPVRIYQTSFYNNFIANQVDFSFLNNTYQAFNGGAPYFNPGFNLLTKIGAVDVFEDIKLTAGFRFSSNFESNEYMFAIENLKGNIDKHLVFYRQAFNSLGDSSLFKVTSNNIYLTFSKPITPVLALKGTGSYRHDLFTPLATDMFNLHKDGISRHWGGLKGEIVFDNTRKRSVNIYYGTRFKVFGEYYREITQKKSDMFVVGGDFRHYLKIHRELIWANRFAASSSFGPSRLIYYLGGVDNWLGFLFARTPMFDNSIPVSPDYNYAFQATATNMRGFTQNIRNGNSFALINSEIRWPFIRYFAGHPLRSDFLNSLQIVAFGDVGTAWTGSNPWSGENAYDTETIKNGPITVILDTNREPIVGGFGAGARAQLMGYFIRADLAWGVENSYILPKIFYLSFSLDF